ncbi:MAG: glycosyltransferase, partial [Planctomycetota bacterium]
MDPAAPSPAPLAVAVLGQGWYPDVGGVESHTRVLARELRRRGHRVRALCADSSEGRAPYSTRDEEVEGVAVRRMAYRYHDHRALADVVENARAERVVEAWLGSAPTDVLHVHHPTAFGIGALRAAERAGVPLVLTLHDYWALCPRGQMMRPDRGVCARPEPSRCGACLAETWPALMPSGGGERRGPGGREVPNDAAAAAARTAFALECLERPARLLAPSAAARAVYGAAGLDAARIEVCPNGIEVAELAREVARRRAEIAPAPGTVRLGVIGAVLPSKGVLELARAVQAASVPGLVLEIHGPVPSCHGDESYGAELAALAAADARVRLHGPFDHDGLAEILAGLDGVAAPSRWAEVFGLSVREAASAGLPVLVSDAGDLPAVADGGRAGIVVPAGDEGAWVEALRRFGTDAAARRRWAAAAP